MSEDVTIDTTTVAMTIDDRFVSSGWEMWSYTSWLTRLNNPVWRKLVANLGPGVLRVGGITCDWVYYDIPSLSEKRGFWPDKPQNLTMDDFQALINLAAESNLQLLFDLNEIQGRNCHVNNTERCEGPWDTTNVEAFLTYIRDNKVGPIFGFELGNEMTNYDIHITIQQNVIDYNTLHSIMVKIWPDGASRPPLYGPSIDYCNADATTFMQGTKSFLTGFTYHTYPGQAGTNLTEQLVDINWLKENIILNDPHAHSEVCLQTWEQIGKPAGLELWITETSSSYASVEGVMNTFYNGFWYLASLGQYALTGVGRHHHWSLVGGTWGLINDSTNPLSANTDYWIAVLHKKVIGTKVLKATSTFDQILVYAHCGKQSRSVTLIVINPSKVAVPLTLSGLTDLQRDEYILTAATLSSYDIQLNGKTLRTNPDGSLPPLNGQSASGQPMLPPHSYGFLVFSNGATICN